MLMSEKPRGKEETTQAASPSNLPLSISSSGPEAQTGDVHIFAREKLGAHCWGSLILDDSEHQLVSLVTKPVVDIKQTEEMGPNETILHAMDHTFFESNHLGRSTIIIVGRGLQWHLVSDSRTMR